MCVLQRQVVRSILRLAISNADGLAFQSSTRHFGIINFNDFRVLRAEENWTINYVFTDRLQRG